MHAPESSQHRTTSSILTTSLAMISKRTQGEKLASANASSSSVAVFDCRDFAQWFFAGHRPWMLSGPVMCALRSCSLTCARRTAKWASPHEDATPSDRAPPPRAERSPRAAQRHRVDRRPRRKAQGSRTSVLPMRFRLIRITNPWPSWFALTQASDGPT